MRKLTAIFVIAAVATSGSAMAASASKEESIGVGSGVVIGALAGGPIGEILGAAVGARVGDTMNRKSSEIDTLNGSLDRSRQELQSLHGDIDTLNAELEHYAEIDRPQLVSLMQAGIAMDLLFRTDEHVLADTTGARLAGLAADLAKLRDVHIQLDGYADERGDADYNLELSRKRVEFVRDQLVSAGIDPQRIRYSAHGEAPAQDDSADSYALERRVAVKLFIAGDSAELPEPFAQAAN